MRRIYNFISLGTCTNDVNKKYRISVKDLLEDAMKTTEKLHKSLESIKQVVVRIGNFKICDLSTDVLPMINARRPVQMQ